MMASNCNDFASEMFSKEIQNLLHKKIFSKSKNFSSSKKLPRYSLSSETFENSRKLSVVKNYFFCGSLLIAYFIKIFKISSKNKNKQLILIYSLSKQQAVRNRSLKSINLFLKSKEITNKSDLVVLIEIRKILMHKNYEMTQTTFDIPLCIFAKNFSLKSKITCWFIMFKRFLKIIKLQRKNWWLLLIFKEFIFDEVVYSTLNPNIIDKIITTQSHLAYQPLAFEFKKISAKKLMIWYSSNSVPIRFKNSNLERYEINPVIYKNMSIDEHWVWTKEHKNYLDKYSGAKVLVKHSLMFYEADKSINSKPIYDVLIFDVTPQIDAQITKNSIYTTKEMTKFISDILLCIEELDLKYGYNTKVVLKHKRKSTKHHSLEYSKFIKDKIKNKQLQNLDSGENLYKLISQSKLIIGFPFTSPVIIGKELNKPSVFYCSSKMLKSAHKNQKNSFLQNRTLLYEYLEEKLVKSN
jgi:polysaccharide biosynthesis PFTS motif protein